MASLSTICAFRSGSARMPGKSRSRPGGTWMKFGMKDTSATRQPHMSPCRSSTRYMAAGRLPRASHPSHSFHQANSAACIAWSSSVGRAAVPPLPARRNGKAGPPVFCAKKSDEFNQPGTSWMSTPGFSVSALIIADFRQNATGVPVRACGRPTAACSRAKAFPRRAVSHPSAPHG